MSCVDKGQSLSGFSEATVFCKGISGKGYYACLENRVDLATSGMFVVMVTNIEINYSVAGHT